MGFSERIGTILNWTELSMFLRFCVHSAGFQSVNESTTNFFSSVYLITGSGLQPLADIIRIYVPSRQLRSSSDIRLFQNRSVKRKLSG